MAVKVDTIDTLKKYFEQVTKRANHHAPNVSDIIYSLLGIIILKKDAETSIEVRGSDDATGNILWVIINGRRIALRYEHSDGTIEVRQETFKGPIVLKIDNSTTVADILAVL